MRIHIRFVLNLRNKHAIKHLCVVKCYLFSPESIIMSLKVTKMTIIAIYYDEKYIYYYRLS